MTPDLPTQIQVDDKTRFFSKIRKDIDGHWRWLDRNTPKGDGDFWLVNRNSRAHRMAWTIYRGEIPQGLFVCHHCDIPEGVHPTH